MSKYLMFLALFILTVACIPQEEIPSDGNAGDNPKAEGNGEVRVLKVAYINLKSMGYSEMTNPEVVAQVESLWSKYDIVQAQIDRGADLQYWNYTMYTNYTNHRSWTSADYATSNHWYYITSNASKLMDFNAFDFISKAPELDPYRAFVKDPFAVHYYFKDNTTSRLSVAAAHLSNEEEVSLFTDFMNDGYIQEKLTARSLTFGNFTSVDCRNDLSPLVIEKGDGTCETSSVIISPALQGSSTVELKSPVELGVDKLTDDKVIHIEVTI